MKKIDKTYLFISSIEFLNKNNFDLAYNLLSKERKNKTDRLVMMDDKRRSIASELLTKYALKKLDIDDEIMIDENNKPFLKNKELYFNVSHSGKYVICAISNGEVGCDIEMIKDVNIDISKHYFTNDEYLDIINSKIDKRNEVFLRYWTLKESFIKSIGKGLSIPLNSFEIIIDSEIKMNQNINDNNYYFDSFIYDGYLLAICNTIPIDLETIEVNLNSLI